MIFIEKSVFCTKSEHKNRKTREEGRKKNVDDSRFIQEHKIQEIESRDIGNNSIKSEIFEIEVITR